MPRTMEFIDADLGLASAEIAEEMDTAIFYQQKEDPFVPTWGQANAMYNTTFTPQTKEGK